MKNENRDRDNKTTSEISSHKQITVIIGCLIKDNKVLLVQRNEKECLEANMKWELPGGKVDFNETPEESLKREFMEETGVEVEIEHLIPKIQTSYWNYEWGRQQTLVLCYKCKFIEQNVISRDHHVNNISWVDLREIDTLLTLPGTKEFIKLSLENL